MAKLGVREESQQSKGPLFGTGRRLRVRAIIEVLGLLDSGMSTRCAEETKLQYVPDRIFSKKIGHQAAIGATNKHIDEQGITKLFKKTKIQKAISVLSNRASRSRTTKLAEAKVKMKYLSLRFPLKGVVITDKKNE